MNRSSQAFLAFLVLVSYVCIATPAEPVSWNAGFIVIGEASDVTPSSLFPILEGLFKKRVPKEIHQTLHMSRIQESAGIAMLESQHETIRELDGEIPVVHFEKTTIVDFEYPVPATWIEITRLLEKSLAPSLVLDPVILRHALFLFNLDELYICRVSRIDEFTRCQLFVAEYPGELSKHVLYDGIVTKQDVNLVMDRLTAAIASWWEDAPRSVIQIHSTAPATRFLLDGSQLNDLSLPVLVSPGVHVITASAGGSEEKVFNVLTTDFEVTSVEIDLEVEAGLPLLVTSNVSDVYFNMHGTNVHTRLPFLLKSRDPLFAYTATKNGELLVSDQVAVEMDHLHIEIPTSSLPNSWLLDTSQKAFYNSLGKSLITTGFAIAVQSIIGSLDAGGAETRAFESLGLLSAGVAAVDVLQTLRLMFAYYKKTQYSSR